MSKNIDQIYIANPITSNASTDLMYFGQSPYGSGDNAAMTYSNFAAQFGAPYTASALTKVNDTNVTLTLGGTPGTALLESVSLTLGWTGTLSGARGGTGIANSGLTINLASGSTGYLLTSDSSGNATWQAPSSSVSSITGTANEVLVNGGTGPVSGSVTLTTPQAIGTTSTPTFASLTLSSPLTVANGGTGSSTYTSGSILYYNGSIITQNNSNFSWNNSTDTLSVTNIDLTSTTASTALIANSSNNIVSSITTSTELSYVHGVTSSIQTQINSITGSAITSLTGDVVASGPGAAASTIQPNVVTNAKLAQAPTDTIKGNNTGSTANVTDLTGTQVTALLTPFVGDSGSGGTQGVVPAPPTASYGSGDFLSAGGSWVYVDQSKTINQNFTLVTQGPVPSGSPGTIKYETTTIFTSIVTGKNYAIGVGFVGSPTLTIWDISDQTNPIIAGTITISGGGAYNCTVGVVSGVQYAFVGFNSGSKLEVINLTNPSSPSVTSSTALTGSVGSVYGVSFLNGYVYCATQSAGLVVMDVGGGSGSPGTPSQVFTQGSPYKSFGVVAIGTNVYTTYYSTSSPYTTRQIISWTLTGLGSPSSPSLLQSLQVTSAGEALGLSISGNAAFVTTAASGAYNINLVDITTPSSMSNLSQINSSNAFGSAFYAVGSGNYVYVPSGNNATYGGAIDVYDITTRSSPIHIAQVTTGNANSGFGGIALSGGYIFCADYGVPASNNGYFDVFTQINANAIIGEMLSSTAYVESLTASTALVSSSNNEIISSITTATELSYVHGATSNIQAQINAITTGVLPWTVETSSITLVKGNGYFANSASTITFTLPTTAVVGDTYLVSNMNSGNMVIAQNPGQSIRWGNEVTTTGTGGNITSTNPGDSLYIVCNATNSGFQAVNSQGQLNVT